MTRPDHSALQKYSNAQSTTHFIFLSIISFSIYNLVWFYRNWKYLKEHKNLNISPGWRTAGLFVPIWGLVLAYRQFKDIADYCQEEDIHDVPSPGATLAVYIILGIFYKLPNPFWVIAVLSALPLANMQEKLNLYWGKTQPGLPERERFTDGQIVLIVIGVISWLLVIIGIFSPETASHPM